MAEKKPLTFVEQQLPTIKGRRTLKGTHTTSYAAPVPRSRIIFRRINGRIVPIVNKHAIGEDLKTASYKTARIGLGVTGAGLIKGGLKHPGMKKGRVGSFIRKTKDKARQLERYVTKPRPYDTATYKAFRKTTKGGLKASKLLYRNPFKVGIGLIGMGAMTEIFVASELRAQSHLGAGFLKKDYYPET